MREMSWVAPNLQQFQGIILGHLSSLNRCQEGLVYRNIWVHSASDSSKDQRKDCVMEARSEIEELSWQILYPFPPMAKER